MALKTVTLSVRTDDLDAFVTACIEAGWLLEDTGDRVMTDEGPEAEAVVRVTIPARKPSKDAILAVVPC